MVELSLRDVEYTHDGTREDIGPLIGGMAGDRPRWLARVSAAHETAAEQLEIEGDSLVTLGYCFGGASALEHLRTGGAVNGVISIHGGLDLLESDWSAATSGTQVLLSTGASDPMATAEQPAQLQQMMTEARISWEVTLYSDTKHAFTSPDAGSSGMPGDVVGYHPRNTDRAWDATTRFLGEVFPDVRPIPQSATRTEQYVPTPGPVGLRA